MPEIKMSKATPSKAARELAEALFPDFTPEIHVGYADIIQSHVSALLEKAQTLQCVFGNYAPSPTCACNNCDLAKALEPWKPQE